MTVPEVLRQWTGPAVECQRVIWRNDGRWRTYLERWPRLVAELEAEVARHDGIRRSFVHDKAHGDPTVLLLTAMAWGFGTTHRNLVNVGRMVAVDDLDRRVAEIVEAVRRDGARAGWSALFARDTEIKGLKMGFGTKLLYFAGYTAASPGPRPLVLDQFVCAGLQAVGVDFPNPGRVYADDYMTYLALAEEWSAASDWDATPDTVELALFEHGKKERPARRRRR